MIRLALDGTIMTLLVYTPLVFYVVWSWIWLRQHNADAPGSGVWPPLAATAVAVAAVWTFLLSFIAGYRVLAYETPDMRVFVTPDQAFPLALVPAQAVLFIVASILPWPISDGDNVPLPFWVITAAVTAVLLLAVSFMQQRFIRRKFVSQTQTV